MSQSSITSTSPKMSDNPKKRPRHESSKASETIVGEAMNNSACKFCKIVPRWAPIYVSCDGRDWVKCSKCYDKSSEKEKKNVRRSSLIEKLLLAIPVTACKYKRLGCDVIDDVDSVRDHESKCPYREIICIFPDCSETISIPKLIMHIRETHRRDIKTKSKSLAKQDDGSGYVIKIKVYPEDYYRDDKKQLYHGIEVDGKRFVVQSAINYQSKSPTMLWVQMLETAIEAEKYQYWIRYTGPLNSYYYRGRVNSLEDKKSNVLRSMDGFIVPFAVFKRNVQNNCFLVEVGIINIEKEQMRLRSIDLKQTPDRTSEVHNFQYPSSSTPYGDNTPIATPGASVHIKYEVTPLEFDDPGPADPRNGDSDTDSYSMMPGGEASEMLYEGLAEFNRND